MIVHFNFEEILTNGAGPTGGGFHSVKIGKLCWHANLYWYYVVVVFCAPENNGEVKGEANKKVCGEKDIFISLADNYLCKI